jgi:hypothetical protein
MRGTKDRMNERLTEQDLDEIAARLAVWRAHDGRFSGNAATREYVPEALDYRELLDYAEQLLQDVRAARQVAP